MIFFLLCHSEVPDVEQTYTASFFVGSLMTQKWCMHSTPIPSPPPPPQKKAIIENQYHNNGEQSCVFSLIANYEQFTKVVNSWQNK